MKRLIWRLRAVYGRPIVGPLDMAVGRCNWDATADMAGEMDRLIFGPDPDVPRTMKGLSSLI